MDPKIGPETPAKPMLEHWRIRLDQHQAALVKIIEWLERHEQQINARNKSFNEFMELYNTGLAKLLNQVDLFNQRINVLFGERLDFETKLTAALRELHEIRLRLTELEKTRIVVENPNSLAEKVREMLRKDAERWSAVWDEHGKKRIEKERTAAQQLIRDWMNTVEKLKPSDPLPPLPEIITDFDWWVHSTAPVERVFESTGPIISTTEPDPNDWSATEHIDVPRPISKEIQEYVRKIEENRKKQPTDGIVFLLVDTYQPMGQTRLKSRVMLEIGCAVHQMATRDQITIFPGDSFRVTYVAPKPGEKPTVNLDKPIPTGRQMTHISMEEMVDMARRADAGETVPSGLFQAEIPHPVKTEKGEVIFPAHREEIEVPEVPAAKVGMLDSLIEPCIPYSSAASTLERITSSILTPLIGSALNAEFGPMAVELQKLRTTIMDEIAPGIRRELEKCQKDTRKELLGELKRVVSAGESISAPKSAPKP